MLTKLSPKLQAQMEAEWRRRWERVLYMRDEQRLTFAEIGTLLGVTKARAFQLYKRALRAREKGWL